MMYYELLQQGPAVYVPVLLIMILITLVAYGAFPIILAMARKKTLTKKKYNLLCYGVNFFVMFLFIVLNEKSSGSPYILWTCVFSSIGLKTLKRRGVLEEFQNSRSVYTDEIEDSSFVDENKIDFCRKCGNKLLDGAKFCNKCGTEIIEKVGGQDNEM